MPLVSDDVALLQKSPITQHLVTDTMHADGWSPVDGGVSRACRGAHSKDNSADYYSAVKAASLIECKQRCVSSPTCNGIEYSSGRCELWSRTGGIGASIHRQGFDCWRYEPTSLDFAPVDGGVDRACRGASPSDNRKQYFTVARVKSLDDCMQLCRNTLGCIGIESSKRRCEVWTRPGGIESSAPGSGFSCFRYGGIAPKATTSTTTYSTSTPVTSSSPYCGIAVTVYNCREEVDRLKVKNPAVGESFAQMCMGYGGTHPPTWLGKNDKDRDLCTLNINNDCDHWYEATPGNWECAMNYGIDKNPDDCHGNYFFLWDEPMTQGKDAAWAARQWKKHVTKWSSQIVAMKSRGVRVTTPLFTDHGGSVTDKLTAFFDNCAECNDPSSAYYIDVLAMNQWLLNPRRERNAQEKWIRSEVAAIRKAHAERPAVLSNFAWLGATTADEQAEAIANSRIWDRAWSGLEAVYYFSATDYGGGTVNNGLDSVTRDGTTIGEALLKRCSAYQR